MPAKRLSSLTYIYAGLKDMATVFGNVTPTHLYFLNLNYLKGKELERNSIPSGKTKDCMPLALVPNASLFKKHFPARCIMETHLYIYRYIHGVLVFRHCVFSV